MAGREKVENQEYSIRETKGKGHFKKEAANSSIWCSQAIMWDEGRRRSLDCWWPCVKSSHLRGIVRRSQMAVGGRVRGRLTWGTKSRQYFWEVNEKGRQKNWGDRRWQLKGDTQSIHLSFMLGEVREKEGIIEGVKALRKWEEMGSRVHLEWLLLEGGRAKRTVLCGEMCRWCDSKWKESPTDGFCSLCKEGTLVYWGAGLPSTFRRQLQIEPLHLQWHQSLGKYTSSS